MKRRLLIFCMILSLLVFPVRAQSGYIKWVDLDVSADAMRRAISLSEQAMAQEQPRSWLEYLALAAVYGGGKVTTAHVARAEKAFSSGKSVKEILGGQKKYYDYYYEAYSAALGGLVGNYAIGVTQEETGATIWKSKYGVKAFSPIAAGYGYGHYDDFGAGRSYGFARKHLGNDLMGGLGTPIIAVEGGTVEAMGWNQYGGWRVGIRSHDRRRYYYYAHLRKDAPFAPGLKEGDTVQAGDVIGFMGRTGYSVKENVNNINVVHLHFGLQLIFDESQKECNSEIWVDVYDIINLLDSHRSSVRYDETAQRWVRLYPFRDLDTEQDTEL